MMYKLYKAGIEQTTPNAVMTVGVEPCKSFLFDPANSDFQQFKLDLADGVELQDADGNTMTAEEVAEFVATLPE